MSRKLLKLYSDGKHLNVADNDVEGSVMLGHIHRDIGNNVFLVKKMQIREFVVMFADLHGWDVEFVTDNEPPKPTVKSGSEMILNQLLRPKGTEYVKPGALNIRAVDTRPAC